jgi:hypothetical protein
VRRVKEEADRLGLTTKLRPGKGGRMRGGKPLSRGYIYHLLGNPLYVGRIAHKGESFEGQHPAIVDPEIWDAAQARLAANTRERSSGTCAGRPSPLRGKLFDEAGTPLSPSHAVKSGRRYRYYVSRDLIARSAESSTNERRKQWRLPAREIERLVGDAVTALLADRAALTRLVRDAEIEAERVPELLGAVRDWMGAPLDLVKRVELGHEEIAIHVDLSRFLSEQDAAVRHVIPARIRRRGVEMRLVLDSAENGPRPHRPDPALIKAVVRANRWFEDLVNGRGRSFRDIAKEEGLTHRYVGHLLPLAFLAPDIVAAILAGRQPVDLTAETLTKRIDIPLAWAEQEALLGFD